MRTVALAAAVSTAGIAFSGDVIWDDRPADGNWQGSWYPLGNGELGCMVDGGTDNFRVQFNLDSLWTGAWNVSSAVGDEESCATDCTKGGYQDFGELLLYSRTIGPVSGYRRALSLSDAVYTDGFEVAGAGWFTDSARMDREVFVSRPDGAVVIHVRRSRPFPIEIMLRGAHFERSACRLVGCDGKRGSIEFSGRFANELAYAARVDVIDESGVRITDDGQALVVGNGSLRGACEFTVYLRARTSLDLGRPDYGLNGHAVQIGDGGLPEAQGKAKERHLSDYHSLWSRAAFHLQGGGDFESLPTRERVRLCRTGKRDIGLEELLFGFGRYLLISSSRPGTLPANLQGIWNASNRPEWQSDYHTNINLQMNYWGVDVANLFECFLPLADWMKATRPVVEAGTRAAFPGSRGFAYRTSVNFIGGGGWKWNYAGAPWLAVQCYDHYLFTCDERYLRDTAWPIMKGAADFLISCRLKERADGSVVVKDGWSPEHGPREDGVAHDQQIVRELFRAILAAARDLKVDDAFTREIARLEPKLLRDKIGSWGQLQEWETDRDVNGDDHRHTSHLFAVYPGTTITRSGEPEFLVAAKTSLEGRVLAGDARRSWVWPWRAAMWARFGDGERAGRMIAALLEHNALDNLFCTCPPIQIDGNLGIVAGIGEMLIQSHEEVADGRPLLRLLPALPKSWPNGEFRGLRARGGYEVDCRWEDGRVLKYEVRGGSCKPEVRVGVGL